MLFQPSWHIHKEFQVLFLSLFKNNFHEVYFTYSKVDPFQVHSPIIFLVTLLSGATITINQFQNTFIPLKKSLYTHLQLVPISTLSLRCPLNLLSVSLHFRLCSGQRWLIQRPASKGISSGWVVRPRSLFRMDQKL